MMILVTGVHGAGRVATTRGAYWDSSQVLYIATSQLDDEMAARIEHHRQGRWSTGAQWSAGNILMN